MVPVPVAFGLPLGSKLIQPLNTFLLKMQQSGLKDKLKQRWGIHNVKDDNVFDDDDSAVVLGFENVSFPFIFLGIGSGAAIFLSFLELCARKMVME